MQHKICLVTGATSGIGAATAESLAGLGATVVLVGRDRARCEAAAARVAAHSAVGSADFLVGDLSVQADVRRIADEFRQKYDRLHVLINNASAIFLRRQETVDGIEATFALNHLAYFLLTNLLLDRLQASAPARIVNVASVGHMRAKAIDFDDLQSRRWYRGFQAYHQSKLANVSFTYELARRIRGSNVTVNALHPGMVATNIGRNNGWIWRVLKPLGDRVFGFKYVSAAEGARTVVYLASSPDVAAMSGKYLVDQREAKSSAASHDEAAARRLWQASEELTGLNASIVG
jgi:NAD(P)-dependent dehydrogenase (short-subunit alcohol dehydrogenase family)